MFKQMILNINENILTRNKETPVANIIKNILLRRGISEDSQREKFLKPELADLYDPFLLKDMQIAVSKIIKAVKNKEKIVIYGDYDVDGITSTTLLYRIFKKLFAIDVDYYLPDRAKEGYGLNLDAVRKLVEENYQLMITVDCGITAVKEIEFARKHGLDVIVTDHHQPGDKLPVAEAIINPHQKEDNYPFKYLAGVGVAYKLCQALVLKTDNNYNSFLNKQLDIVALGSVADIVPLKGENRILVKKGIEIFFDCNNTGLAVLLKKLGLKNEMTAGKIGYIVAPPLNAAGRITDASMGIELLTASSKDKAGPLADKLVQINRQRQQKEQETLHEALEMIDREVDLKKEKGIVLASRKWHPGVIGIVASRLVEKYYRPVVLISLQDDVGRGSCRSIEPLNMFELLKKCGDSLLNFGGHSQAAGLKIKTAKVADFRKMFNNYLDKLLKPENLIPCLKLDFLLEKQDITAELYERICDLKPHGPGNPAPRFLLNFVKLKKYYCVGKEKEHLKIFLDNGLQGIGFNMGHLSQQIEQHRVDLAFKLSMNEWQGKKNIELVLEQLNIRPYHSFYPVYFKTKKWQLSDKRGIKDNLKYIEKINEKHKAPLAIFINNKKMQKIYQKKLNKNNIGCRLLFQGFDSGDTVIEDLVFCSLPFSFKHFFKVLKDFSFKSGKVHFLFGEREYFLNRNILEKRIPTQKYLREFYNNLFTISANQLSKKKLISFMVDKNILSGEKLLNTSLKIGEELGVININKEIITINKRDLNLDLFASISYNRINGVISEFNEFSKMAYAKNIFLLMRKVEEDFYKEESNNV